MIMFVVPEKLLPFVDFDEGEIIPVNLPADLEEEFQAVKSDFEKMKADKFTDY